MAKLIRQFIIDETTPQVQEDSIWLRLLNSKNPTRFAVNIPMGTVWQAIGIYNVSVGVYDDADIDDAIAEDRMKEIYYGNEEPENKGLLWLDPIDQNALNPEYYAAMRDLREAVADLTANQEKLMRLINFGVIAGDATNSVRTDTLVEEDTMQQPGTDEEGEEYVEEEVEKPDVTDYTHTVPALVVKCDTAANFRANIQNLTDGEILFFTDEQESRRGIAIYYQGKFYRGGSGGSSGGSSDGEGLTIDDLYALVLEYLNFTDGSSNYKLKVDKTGTLSAKEYSSSRTVISSPDATYKVYVSQFLSIASVYCGGEGDDKALVSHNFVELHNGDSKDINLNGILLLYTDCSKRENSDVGYAWKVLKLNGIIKAGSTFLIRGAKCNEERACLIKVNHYDMEWIDGGSPIKFSQGRVCFYLAVADSTNTEWVDDVSGSLIGANDLSNPWVAGDSNIKVGYIDSCGFGTNAPGEGSAPLVPTESWRNLLFTRWFYLETASQGNKAYNKRKTRDLWTYINLEKQTERLGNSVQYYYPDWMKQRNAPQDSISGKNFFTNKTGFDENKPNCINVTFGIQATADSTNNIKASRCFNWVSVGYFDEYLEYKKATDSTWTRIYSITANNASNTTAVNKFIHFYGRLRWCAAGGQWVTTHKVILLGVLTSGEYEYRIGRDNNLSYTSGVRKFTVRESANVSSFKFIQTTDQQAFNWMEYQAWKRAADMIKANETGYDFFVNTGDMTQSGNRENEWIDYWDAEETLHEKEVMFTIGNNDLCGYDTSRLTNGATATSKFNHINILRYFTFELDPDLDYTYTWDGTDYPLYSLYSFNYGPYHFISLNSEIARESSKMYVNGNDDNEKGDATMAETANAKIEQWLLADLQKWTGQQNPTNCSKCFVYMHEMPFTMVTWDFMGSTSERGGSHLNTLNDNGKYRFSRLFKKYGIKLVFGGHKHTYTLSKPIYDAPDGYITEEHTVNGDVDLMGEVNGALSRVPVIQVTSAEQIPEEGSAALQFARYELVQSISAPTYVMSQATGYKLVSNKEQPSGPEYTIPWLLSYFKAITNSAEPTENVRQHKPMYIVYSITSNSITVTAKQVENIWEVNPLANNGNGSKTYDFNHQIANLEVTPMTCVTTSDADRAAYSINNIESYTINI